MKTTLKKLPKSRVKLTIELTQEEMAKYFDEAYEELAPMAKIKGFRPGKAPKEMTINAIGEERIKGSAIDKAVPHSLVDALRKEDLISVSPPTIAIKSMDNGLSYEAEVDIWPTIELGNYKKLRIKLPAEEDVKDDEIEAIVNHLRRHKSQMKKVDREAKKSDWVEIDFTGSLNGVVQEKMTSQHHPLILGEGTLIPGFEENLEGMKAGEDKTFTVKFPKDYAAKELAGKPAEFKVHMHMVQEVILPEIDDAFAKDFGHDNLQVLREAIKKNIKEEKDMRRQQEIESAVLEKVLTVTKMEVPESLIEQEIDRTMERLTAEAARYGLTAEQYMATMKKKPEELRQEWRGQAEKNARIGLMLGEIAKQENIDKEDKESARKLVEKLVGYLTE